MCAIGKQITVNLTGESEYSMGRTNNWSGNWLGLARVSSESVVKSYGEKQSNS